MKLSKNILLASCLSVVFMASAASCIVEDRNLEEKGAFRCMSDDDCLKGSVCVKPSLDPTVEGVCTLEKEVDHCHDYDNDGYFAADPGYEDQCGFGEKNPKDLDDSNPSVNPGADEICDGVDNNQDGCVDGTCAKSGACTGDDKSQCLRLFRPCVGVSSLEELIDMNASKDPNTKLIVCDPVQFGGMFCVAKKDSDGKVVGGEFKFGFYSMEGRSDYANEGDVVYHEDQQECQKSDEIKYDFTASYQTERGSQSTKYLELEDHKPNQELEDPGDSAYDKYYGNGVDEDCDGKDVPAEQCVVPPEKSGCFVSSIVQDIPEKGTLLTTYNGTLEKCKKAFAGLTEEEVLAKCGCIGKYECEPESTKPVCKSGGYVIDKDKITEYIKADPSGGNMFWNCLNN